MAQYYWSADSGDIGGSPSNASVSQPSRQYDDIRVEDTHPHSTVDGDIGSSDRPFLLLDATDLDNEHVLLFDAIDGQSIADSSDVEIYLRVANVGSGSLAAPTARYSGGSGSETTVFGGEVRANSDSSVGYYDTGDLTFVESINIDLDDYEPKNLLFRADGSSFSYKVWRGSEPSGWDIETTDSTISQSGGVGFIETYAGTKSDSFDAAIIEFGVGTNGDSAPQSESEATNPAYFETTITGTSPSDPIEGDQIDVSYSVDNTGDVGDTQTMELLIDGALVDTQSQSISGGGSATGTLSWQSSVGGTGTYTATVSPDGNGGDDSTSITLGDQAYLVLTEDSISPASPVEGETVTVSFNAENTGDEATTTTVELLVNGSQVSTTDTSVGANSTVTDSIAWDTSVGDGGSSYTLTVRPVNSDDGDGFDTSVTVTEQVPATISAPLTAGVGRGHDAITVETTIGVIAEPLAAAVDGNSRIVSTAIVGSPTIAINAVRGSGTGNAPSITGQKFPVFQPPTAVSTADAVTAAVDITPLTILPAPMTAVAGDGHAPLRITRFPETVVGPVAGGAGGVTGASVTTTLGAILDVTPSPVSAVGVEPVIMARAEPIHETSLFGAGKRSLLRGSPVTESADDGESESET